MPKRKKQCLHSLCKCQNKNFNACIAYANAKTFGNTLAVTLQAINC